MTTKTCEKSSVQHGFYPGARYIENYFALFDGLEKLSQRRMPHKMGGLLLVAGLSGTFRVTLDLKEYAVEQNDVLIVLPGQIIQNVEDEGFEGRFMFMSNEFLANITFRRRNFSAFFAIRDNPLIRFSAQDIGMFTDYYDFIAKRMGGMDPGYRLDVVQNIVGSMFIELMSMDKYLTKVDKQPRMNRQDEICGEFIGLLIKHYKESRCVAFYADKLFITPKYLSATLRAVTGKKAGQLIDDYVLLQAKVMLKSTNMTIQQISEELSFANQSFFARYFKHLCGITPTQYRNE